VEAGRERRSSPQAAPKLTSLPSQPPGTTGYEEAASLGLVAGLNAALARAERPPLVLGREEAYIGVLVDDLVTRGTTEPYRMFTSRAEHRLLLRADNADQRLTPRGEAVGCVSPRRSELLAAKVHAIAEGRAALSSHRLSAAAWARHGFEVGASKAPRTAEQVLATAGATLDRVEAAVHSEALRAADGDDVLSAGPATAVASSAAAATELGASDPAERPPLVAPIARESVEVAVKYGDYVRRQEREVARIRRHQGLQLPHDLNYSAIPSLSNEEVEKLSRARPRTLQEASQISGVTPCCVSTLLFHIRSTGHGGLSEQKEN
jgi:tRNA uridine 5-carboxymethylaminomethyl modification enzyme